MSITVDLLPAAKVAKEAGKRISELTTTYASLAENYDKLASYILQENIRTAKLIIGDKRSFERTFTITGKAQEEIVKALMAQKREEITEILKEIDIEKEKL